VRGTRVTDADLGGGVERWFTVEEARAFLPELLAIADELVEVRAQLTLANHALEPPVALADRKALEARLSDLLDRLVTAGVHVKGWAPLLVDFPMQHEGRVILLCWLEGDRTLEWFHDAEHGFPGRRRLSELGY
jgi:hypothetical protein